MVPCCAQEPTPSGRAQEPVCPSFPGHHWAGRGWLWQSPDLPVVAKLARLAVGEEEVVGEEDRLWLTGGLLRSRRISSCVVHWEGRVSDAGGMGRGGWRWLRGWGRVRQALHWTCNGNGWPQMRDSSGSPWPLPAAKSRGCRRCRPTLLWGPLLLQSCSIPTADSNEDSLCWGECWGTAVCLSKYFLGPNSNIHVQQVKLMVRRRRTDFFPLYISVNKSELCSSWSSWICCTSELVCELLMSV